MEVTNIVVGACDEGVGVDVCWEVKSVLVVVEAAVVDGAAKVEESSEDASVVDEAAAELADAPVPIGTACRCLLSLWNSAADTKESTASSATNITTTLYERLILRRLQRYIGWVEFGDEGNDEVGG